MDARTERLTSLMKKKMLAPWEENTEFVPAAGLADTRAALKDCIQRLLDLGASASSEESVAVMRDCSTKLILLNRSYPGMIETMEREDLAEALTEIGNAAGLQPTTTDIEEWFIMRDEWADDEG